MGTLDKIKSDPFGTFINVVLVLLCLGALVRAVVAVVIGGPLAALAWLVVFVILLIVTTVVYGLTHPEETQ